MEENQSSFSPQFSRIERQRALQKAQTNNSTKKQFSRVDKQRNFQNPLNASAGIKPVDLFQPSDTGSLDSSDSNSKKMPLSERIMNYITPRKKSHLILLVIGFISACLMLIKSQLARNTIYDVMKTATFSSYNSFPNIAELNHAVSQYCQDPSLWKSHHKFASYGPIEFWDISKTDDLSNLFRNQNKCNPKIDKWKVGHITSFEHMFSGATKFNQDISRWDTSRAIDFSHMFSKAESFNQDISSWDMSGSKRFEYMFYGASAFNQDLNGWDVSNVADFSFMFIEASSFNGDISEWDVSNGRDFHAMFDKASSFNQDISSWDVSAGITFWDMFFDASAFNQNLCSWDISKSASISGFCYGTKSCGDCNYEWYTI